VLFNFSSPPSTLFKQNSIEHIPIAKAMYAGYVRKCGNLEEAFFINSLLWKLLILLDTYPLCGLSCFCAEVAQVVEQRTENSRSSMPVFDLTYKIEQ